MRSRKIELVKGLLFGTGIGAILFFGWITIGVVLVGGATYLHLRTA